MTANNILRRIV